MNTRTRHDETELSESVAAIKEDLHHFKEDVKSLLRDLGHAGKQSLSTAGRHIRNGAEHGAQELRDKAAKVREFGESKFREMDETVQSHPYWTALAALGFGALVGRFFRW